MATQSTATWDFAEPIKSAVASLISARSLSDTVYVSLPLIFPGGTIVTVRIDPAPGGFRVSDSGFAYRELEEIGAERSFAKTADKIIEIQNVLRNKRAIYADVSAEQIERAICDVSTAAWRVVDQIYSRLSEEDVEELEEHLQERLEAIFGALNVRKEPKLIGVSSTQWPMTATVKQGPKITVFQVVGDHANSIYRTSAAFRDLTLLDHPPSLVAVVRDKAALGPKQSFLTQAGGKVIQEDQPDATFLKVAA